MHEYCVFFFSSRRRHTRYWRDWSSDVCSSDLPGLVLTEHEFDVPLDHSRPDGEQITVFAREVASPDGPERPYLVYLQGDRKERRVGKECRSRWSPYH